MSIPCRRVRVVRHPEDPFDKSAYVIHLLIEQWRNQGIAVEVTTSADGPIDPEVLVVPHLDLTITPAAYRSYFSRCPRVLNRGVFDISKRRISRHRVSGPDEYDGPVIVKTNRNAGGAPEVDRARRRGGWRRRMIDAVGRLPWCISGKLGPLQYPVYDHPRQVPRAVWHNPRLIVEQFVAERQGEMYCLRQHTFLGDRAINSIAYSPGPIVKAANVVRREVLDEAPAEILRIRRELGFDYGKFDYVMRDGRVVLFDTNRTPTYNRNSKAGSASPLILSLVDGINVFLGAT